jgi:hypothetical protein
MSEIEHAILRIECCDAIKNHNIARLIVAAPEEGYKGKAIFIRDCFNQGSTTHPHTRPKDLQSCRIVCGKRLLEVRDGWAIVRAGG